MLLYQGMTGFKTVGLSGIGQAVKQQARILERIGVEVVTHPREPHEAAQFNVPFPDSYVQAIRARRAGTKVIWVAHSTEADIRGSFLGANTAAPLLRRLYGRCYATADLVLTPTPYAKRLWLGYGLTTPIEPITNGVDTEFFRPDPEAGLRFRTKYGIAPETKVVVGVGHYFRRKGIVDFVQLARRMPGVEFWWFGFTDLPTVTADVRDQVRTAPANAHFPGFVSRADLRDAYCGAHLFLFPTYEETEGIALLEALACGVPVLVRDIPVYDDWLIDGRHVHKFRSVMQLVDSTRALLNGEMPDLTGAGRELAETHDYEVVARKLESLYRSHGIL